MVADRLQLNKRALMRWSDVKICNGQEFLRVADTNVAESGRSNITLGGGGRAWSCPVYGPIAQIASLIA